MLEERCYIEPAEGHFLHEHDLVFHATEPIQNSTPGVIIDEQGFIKGIIASEKCLSYRCPPVDKPKEVRVELRQNPQQFAFFRYTGGKNIWM